MNVLHQSMFDKASVGAVMIEVGSLVETLVDGRRRLMIMVRELADNAVHHSGEGGGWRVVTQSDDHPEIVIRDRGRGICGSLFHLYPDIDERAAVRWVFRGGVSATADPDRGLGLKMVLDYRQQGATLLLETGGVALVGVGRQARLALIVHVSRHTAASGHVNGLIPAQPRLTQPVRSGPWDEQDHRMPQSLVSRPFSDSHPTPTDFAHEDWG